MKKKENTKIQRWKQEHVLNLAEHFHEFNSNTGQHTRVSQYTLHNDDLKTIQGVWDDIKKMGIQLGLDEQTPGENTITFVPIFTVQLAEETLNFEMIVRPKTTVDIKTGTGNGTMESGFVPQPYVDMVTDNWNTIDFHLIDDLFIVKNKANPERVLSYHITENIIEQLAKLNGNNLLAINLYLGVDMNKFHTAELPSFVPVYGFEFKEASTIDIVKFFQALTGYRSRDITKIEEIFVQYSSPCPPTCEPYIPPNS